MSLEIIILAAGQGTRMHSSLPKVLHAVGGKSLLQHVVEAAFALHPKRVHIVTGHESDQVRASLEGAVDCSRVRWALQVEQNGTGHAVMQAMDGVDPESRCLILCGDVPLVGVDSLAGLCKSDVALSLLTAKVEIPFGLGRIMRDDSGAVIAIVEHKDASAEQLEINEINTGIILCQGEALGRWLGMLNTDNQSGELYLTDIVGLAVSDGEVVHTALAAQPDRLLGINSKAQLAVAERRFQRIQVELLMSAGVTVLDPARLDIRGDVTFGRDCVVDVNVVLEGEVSVGNNVSIGPNCVIRDVTIGDGCNILSNSVIERATLGSGCNVGPFARLRPGTALADGVRIGNFVETKNAQIGVGSKANHLSYIGDSVVGRNTNIGAGVITANYDGANKHQTTIGDNVSIGSDTQLIAPVEIGDGATIGAGSTITRKVVADSLVITRSPLKSISGWKRPVKKEK